MPQRNNPIQPMHPEESAARSKAVGLLVLLALALFGCLIL